MNIQRLGNKSAVSKSTNKYVKRNVLGGLVIACVGGFFLAVSGVNLIRWSAITTDIEQEICDFNGCRPLEDDALSAAIGNGIFGAIVTLIGLFFFIYGIKKYKAPSPQA